MATTYQMPTWMSQTLGLNQPSYQGFVPYAQGMAPQVPVVAQSQTPTQDRLRSLMRLTGGNNAIESEEAARRQAQLALQRDVQREASNAAVRQAIAERKRQQWLSGERTLADEEAGAVAPAYTGQAVPFNPNGVNNGIAYRGGAPVGFSGAVPGVAAIPEAGFNPAERTAFNRQLMNMASQSVQTPQVAQVVPEVPVMDAAIPAVGGMTPTNNMFAFGALAPWRQALMNSVSPQTPTRRNLGAQVAVEPVVEAVPIAVPEVVVPASVQAKSNEELFDKTGNIKASGVIPWLAVNFGSGGAQMVDLFEQYISDPTADFLMGQGSSGNKLNLQKRFLDWVRTRNLPPQ